MSKCPLHPFLFQEEEFFNVIRKGRKESVREKLGVIGGAEFHPL